MKPTVPWLNVLPGCVLLLLGYKQVCLFCQLLLKLNTPSLEVCSSLQVRLLGLYHLFLACQLSLQGVDGRLQVLGLCLGSLELGCLVPFCLLQLLLYVNNAWFSAVFLFANIGLHMTTKHQI